MSIISRYRLIPSWLRPIKAPVSIILCINFFLLVLLAIIGSKKHINIAALMRDPVATAGLPFYTGFFSNLGVLFWFATAVICLFSSWLLLKTQQQREFRIFLFYSGLLSLFLTLDDLFLFHEYDGFLPVVLHIPEKVVYLLYGCVVSSYLLRFRRTIFKTSTYSFMGLALGLLFLSMSLDAVLVGILDISYQMGVLIEDGAKLLGIATWFGYFLTICWNLPTWIMSPQQTQAAVDNTAQD